MDPANPSEKHKKGDTKLFLTLEKTVQDYIGTKLKNSHNGHKLQELLSVTMSIQYKTSYIGTTQMLQNDTKTT
jgi:hypothetical protein